MRFSSLLSPAALLLPLLPAFVPVVLANNDDAIKPLTISANGINATFIGHGARLTNLYVNDKDNNPRDIVVGYDDPAQYIRDTATNRTFFGAIVGRYANRIKNGTFTIGDEEFHVPTNEHNGADTLHGGDIGYDGRNWTVTLYNTSSITYTLVDPDGFQGFPGTVVTHVTYTVSDATDTSRGKLTNRIVSLALDRVTPIMLSTHIYWNLGSFTQSTVLNDTLQIPNGNRIIVGDSLLVPTGEIQSVKYPWQSPPIPLNFTGPKTIGEGALHATQCGAGCTSIDNAYLIDRPLHSGPESMDSDQLIWSSPDTGLTMKVRTNQQGFQIYSCGGQNGTIKSHASQGNGTPPPIEMYGCLVIEPQQYIDGINQPEFGANDLEIFGPTTGPAVNLAEYDFSVGNGW